MISPRKTETATGLSARHWQPSTRPKGTLVLIHGLGEHSGRYDEFANFWVKRDWAVYSGDLPGHGDSPGRRGDALSFESFDNAVGDFIATAKAPFEGLPIYLYGHSFGGLLVTRRALYSPDGVHGFIASSPFFESSKRIGFWKKQSAKLLAAIYPTFRFSTKIRGSELYRDAERLAERRKDPKIFREVTARLIVTAVEQSEKTLRDASRLRSPLLLLHGTEDNVTSHAASCRFAEHTADYCRFVSVTGGKHELHNDECQDLVFAEIEKFLTRGV